MPLGKVDAAALAKAEEVARRIFGSTASVGAKGNKAPQPLLQALFEVVPPAQLQSAHAAAANASNLSFAKHTALVDRSTAAVGPLGLAGGWGAS